jgi:hypothetical protein
MHPAGAKTRFDLTSAKPTRQHCLMNTSLLVAILLLTITPTFVSGDNFTLHEFKKTRLTKEFWAEGACFGDFNHDGMADVAYGPYWYEGPKFAKRHAFRPATQTFKLRRADGSEQTVSGFEGALGFKNAYSETFLSFAYDFNRDGWTDILEYGFPGKEAAWYENPKNQPGFWRRHTILIGLDNESPGFGDVDGDGKPDIVCCSQGCMGYATADWEHPDAPWKFHAISPKGGYQRFTHGLGFGDVNGDGRVDLLEKDGWWEQPASLANAPLWTKHEFKFGGGGAQMFAYDVNGDGLNDIITSLEAHGYGLAWFEQIRDGGQITFREHVIMNREPSENHYGVTFSQLHALDLVDIDGDGLNDIITGKRFWAHGPDKDPEPNAPAVLYWCQLVRTGNGKVEFVPHLVDDDSGVGTQVMAGDINGDKLPDIIVGNKKGAFVFLHKIEKVSKATWENAQPKPFAGAHSDSK